MKGDLLVFVIDFICGQAVRGFEGSLLSLLTHLSVPDLPDPSKTRLERNPKNAGQDEDHFAALPWILSSWPGTSDSLGSSAN